MKNSANKLFLLIIGILCFNFSVLSQNENNLSDPETVVNKLYELVTFDKGEIPDWDKVRSLFIDEAVIILRTNRDSTTIFDLEGFVGDFVSFIENSPVKETGFSEKIIKSEKFIFGDIAQFIVVYEVSIPGTKFKPQLGVDIFHLTKRKSAWKISSIVNEVPSEENPLPETLK